MRIDFFIVINIRNRTHTSLVAGLLKRPCLKILRVAMTTDTGTSGHRRRPRLSPDALVHWRHTAYWSLCEGLALSSGVAGGVVEVVSPVPFNAR